MQDLPAMTMQPFVPHHDCVKTAESQDVLHNSFNCIIHSEREGRETHVNEIGGKSATKTKTDNVQMEVREWVWGKKERLETHFKVRAEQFINNYSRMWDFNAAR